MSYVQSVMFDKNIYGKKDAKRWLKDNGFVAYKVHTTKKYHRYRQVEPATNHQYRIKKISPGISFVIGFE